MSIIFEKDLPKKGQVVKIERRYGMGRELDRGTLIETSPMFRVKGSIAIWNLPASCWRKFYQAFVVDNFSDR